MLIRYKCPTCNYIQDIDVDPYKGRKQNNPIIPYYIAEVTRCIQCNDLLTINMEVTVNITGIQSNSGFFEILERYIHGNHEGLNTNTKE